MVGCEVCASRDNLLRCGQCQNCYCQSHLLSPWHRHEDQLMTSGEAEAEIHGEWCEDDTGQSGSSSASSPNYPADLLEAQLRADQHRRHDESSFVHGWPAESGVSGYAEDWTASGGPAVDNGQYVPQQFLQPLQANEEPDPLWVETTCRYVIGDMDQYGICVIDHFAGQAVGNAVLEEVAALYAEGKFKDGEVVNAVRPSATHNVRGDKIVWVEKGNPICKNIGHIISLVDVIVHTSNKMRGNGKLGEYNISRRSMAMVACYPGGGTQYVKHVDNPNKDGRCITCIYYLNKDWDVQRDGGLLRIFPEELSMSVADIEPVFDRILLFWSDKRNPHEVQPALRTRYAITLWYYDEAEARRHEQAQQIRA